VPRLSLGAFFFDAQFQYVAVLPRLAVQYVTKSKVPSPLALEKCAVVARLINDELPAYVVLQGARIPNVDRPLRT